MVSTAEGTSNYVAALQPLRLTDGVVMAILRYWHRYGHPHLHVGVLALLQRRVVLSNDIIQVTLWSLFHYSVFNLSLWFLNQWKCSDSSNNLLSSLATLIVSIFITEHIYEGVSIVVMEFLGQSQGLWTVCRNLMGNEPTQRKKKINFNKKKKYYKF